MHKYLLGLLVFFFSSTSYCQEWKYDIRNELQNAILFEKIDLPDGFVIFLGDERILTAIEFNSNLEQTRQYRFKSPFDAIDVRNSLNAILYDQDAYYFFINRINKKGKFKKQETLHALKFTKNSLENELIPMEINNVNAALNYNNRLVCFRQNDKEVDVTTVYSNLEVNTISLDTKLKLAEYKKLTDDRYFSTDLRLADFRKHQLNSSAISSKQKLFQINDKAYFLWDRQNSGFVIVYEYDLEKNNIVRKGFKRPEGLVPNNESKTNSFLISNYLVQIGVSQTSAEFLAWDLETEKVIINKSFNSLANDLTNNSPLIEKNIRTYEEQIIQSSKLLELLNEFDLIIAANAEDNKIKVSIGTHFNIKKYYDVPFEEGYYYFGLVFDKNLTHQPNEVYKLNTQQKFEEIQQQREVDISRIRQYTLGNKPYLVYIHEGGEGKLRIISLDQ